MSRVQWQSFITQQKLKVIAIAEKFGNHKAVHRSCKPFPGPKISGCPKLEEQLETFFDKVR